MGNNLVELWPDCLGRKNEALVLHQIRHDPGHKSDRRERYDHHAEVAEKDVGELPVVNGFVRGVLEKENHHLLKLSLNPRGKKKKHDASHKKNYGAVEFLALRYTTFLAGFPEFMFGWLFGSSLVLWSEPLEVNLTHQLPPPPRDRKKLPNVLNADMNDLSA